MERKEGARLAALLLFLAACVVYLATTLYLGRFTATDEVAFKAAGREWARSGRFAAPELSGFGGFDPPVQMIWFAHLPAYTFLFGVYTKVAGFGYLQNIAYDALIHIVLAALTVALCRRLLPHAPPRNALIAGLLVLPIANEGRADELAICFGMAALLSTLSVSNRPWRAGLLLGLTAATSAVAACVFGLHVAILSVLRTRSAAVTSAWLARAALFAGLTFGAAIAPILITHPTAWHQFVSHASGQFSVTYSWALRFSWAYGGRFLLIAAAGVIYLVTGLAGGQRDDALRRFAGPALAAMIIAVFLPAKYYYFWFVGPAVVAGALATEYRLPLRRSAIAGDLIAALMYAGALVVPLWALTISALLPTSQRVEPNAALLRCLIPPGSVVLATEYWSSMANSYEYRSLTHGEPRIEDADFVVLTGNGTGQPGTPQHLSPPQAAKLAADFEPVLDALNRRAPTLFGVRISRSAWGYGPLLLRNVRRNHWSNH